MGDELRGDSLVHLNVRFSTEAELKQTLDFLYVKSKEGISFTGLIEAMVNEVTIVTAIHNIKSNKGSKTAGIDQMKMDKYLQMPKEELIALIRDNFSNYRPKPAKRVYIPKKNGKKRPLGIPTVLDRIIQECVRIIIDLYVKQDFIRTVMDFDLTGHRNTLSEILSMSSMLLLIQKTSLYGRLKEILKGVLTISTTESCYRRYGVLESTIKE